MTKPDDHLANYPDGGTDAVQRLIARLELESVEDTGQPTFIGHAGSRSTTTGQRIFGGLVVAQTIIAVGRAEAPRRIHAIQQVFLRPGQSHIPLRYEVHRMFDGRTYGSVRVDVSQDGKTISHVQVGLTGGVDGPHDQRPDATDSLAAAEVPPLAATDNRDRMRGRSDWSDQPVEMRVSPAQHDADLPSYDAWIRAAAPLPDDPLIHQAILGYATDRGMITAAWRPLRRHGDFGGATLNHSIWFHKPVRFDRWHVHAMRSPLVSDGRGFTRGEVFGLDGELIASTAQEGTIRPVRR